MRGTGEVNAVLTSFLGVGQHETARVYRRQPAVVSINSALCTLNSALCSTLTTTLADPRVKRGDKNLGEDVSFRWSEVRSVNAVSIRDCNPSGIDIAV